MPISAMDNIGNMRSAILAGNTTTRFLDANGDDKSSVIEEGAMQFHAKE